MKHLISVEQFTQENISENFNLIPSMRDIKSAGLQGRDLCSNKVLCNLFFEASTRSRMSFASAFMYLGGKVNSTTGVVFSSISKGESLHDTLRVIPAYCDIVVIRHPELGAAQVAADMSPVPVINAGDGPGEHPTQALLDLYTIYQEKGRLDNLTITMVGDLKFGRTVHSLTKLLCLYENISLIFVAPESIQMPDAIVEHARQKGCTVTLTQDYDEALCQSDVVYVTRIQKERFDDPTQAKDVDGLYILNKERVTRVCKPDTSIMHPLPRTNEIHPDVDDLPNAAYFRQAENGLYVRMALFMQLLKLTL